MSKPQKVASGQAVTAQGYNEIIDRLPTDQMGFGVGGLKMSQTTVKVLNDSGTDRDIATVLSIQSWGGAATAFDAINSPHFVCDDPTWHTDINDIVVLLEPIPDGEFGVAVIGGLAVVKYTDSGDYAMVDPATPTQMKGATSGIARVLGTFTGHAVVDLSNHQRFWHYEMTQNSQSPSTTTCKLLELDGVQYSSAINLTDPYSYMSDQVTGDKGTCYHAGNKFYALQAVCA